MKSPLSFALLAPVPLEHLQSGLAISHEKSFVAFGTRKWELLRKIDEMRGDFPVATLIYPSHEEAATSASLTVSWFGWYVGHVNSRGGAHPDGMLHRPFSTLQYSADNKGHWAAFWHVSSLRQLPAGKQLTIGKVEGLKGGWRKEAPPRGPELVTLPELLVGEE